MASFSAVVLASFSTVADSLASDRGLLDVDVPEVSYPPDLIIIGGVGTVTRATYWE